MPHPVILLVVISDLAIVPQGVTNEDEFLAVANSDISQLCGEIIVLWNAFKSVFVGRSAERRAVVQHLARVHHIQRVRKFN